jgi:CheY-like chemotaxis protein
MHDRVGPPPQPTILVVDASPVDLEIAVRILAGPYGILRARDGRQALELAFSHLPDLILLSALMPDLDGPAVCARLRADAATRFIPVIFMTGTEGDEDEEHALAAGAADHVGKPVRPAVLRNRVRTQLELRRAWDLVTQLSAEDVRSARHTARLAAR